MRFDARLALLIAWPACALAQTVAASGLFYESHLVEFANGLRTVQQLAQEDGDGLINMVERNQNARTAAKTQAPSPRQPRGSILRQGCSKSCLMLFSRCMSVLEHSAQSRWKIFPSRKYAGHARCLRGD